MTLHDLRKQAQNLDIMDIFSKTESELTQLIALKQPVSLPPPQTTPPPANADHAGQEAEITDMLQPFIARGMRLRFEYGQFIIRYLKLEDSGTMQQPLKAIWRCADNLMR